MRHEPTGLEASASAKSQHQNKRTARAILEARVAEHFETTRISGINADRAKQIGSGMRGDKVKTYRTKDDLVTNHLTGQKGRLSKVLRGELI